MCYVLCAMCYVLYAMCYLLFEFLGGWNLVDSDHGQMEESLREAIWQLSEDPYTELISWPLDRFSFFPPLTEGQTFGGKCH